MAAGVSGESSVVEDGNNVVAAAAVEKGKAAGMVKEEEMVEVVKGEEERVEAVKKLAAAEAAIVGANCPLDLVTVTEQVQSGGQICLAAQILTMAVP